MTKNNETRYVPLNDTVMELLNGLESRNTHSDFVFLSSKNKRLKSVRKPFQHAEYIGFSISRFETHVASHFVMNGGDLLPLKEILGHHSIAMVERYAHLAAVQQKDTDKQPE